MTATDVVGQRELARRMQPSIRAGIATSDPLDASLSDTGGVLESHGKNGLLGAGAVATQASQTNQLIAPVPLEPGLSDSQVDTPSLQLIDGEVEFLRRSLDALTTREREVVLAICCGGTNEGIAERLCIALPTLRTHLMRLNQKLGTSSKGDVVRFVAAALIRGYRDGSLGQGNPQSAL